LPQAKVTRLTEYLLMSDGPGDASNWDRKHEEIEKL
jgi:hypothetical protein